MKTIARSYPRRGKAVEVQELADLIAVRRDLNAPPKRRKVSADLESALPEDAVVQVRALRNAGWDLVPKGSAPSGSRVYLRPNGRVLVGTDRLTVRMPETMDEHEARGLLHEAGLEVVEQLRMASNLFVAAVPVSRDPLEAAQELVDSGEVEFAEPQMIEVLSHR